MHIRHVHAKLDMHCIILFRRPSYLYLFCIEWMTHLYKTYIHIHSLTFHQKKTRLMVSGLSKNV